MNKKKEIFMVVGSPGSGKSWVNNQLKDSYDYIPHDDYIGTQNKGISKTYHQAITEKAQSSSKPILIESPFSISQIKDPLEKEGYIVTPIFIVEPDAVISDRYRAREGKEIPKGHLSRQQTYAPVS